LLAKFRSPTDKGDLAVAIDTEIGKLYRGPIAHAVAVGVFKDGKQWFKGFGEVSPSQKTPPTIDTVFQIGSITKAFTGTVLQALANKGAISIDATLADTIGDKVRLHDRVADLTLRHLITHTSGLPRIPKAIADRLVKKVGKKRILHNPYSHAPVEEVFAWLETAKGSKQPGKFKYSNYAAGLLGHVLEVVCDESFESLLQTELFEPLEMNQSGITITPDVRAALAAGYNAKGEPAVAWEFRSLASAGAVYSTAGDMLRFIELSLQPESLAGRLLEQTRQPQFKGYTGLGWQQPGFIDRQFGNANMVWHDGMVGGYASYIAIDSKAKFGVIVLNSKAIDAGMVGMTMTRQVRTQSWAHR